MPATAQTPGRAGPPAPAPRSSFLSDLRVVWAERDFRRLLSIRLISQTGDGIFTAGLGTYVFFNAATFPNPAKGAAAFAVLYAPYSLIGPFAGVFIDRWSRRQILVYSALLRSVFVALTAGLMASGNLGPPLYIAVLLVLGVNRFFLSSLSAALPHVVAGDKLVMGNSVSPTAGGTLAAIGGTRRARRQRGHRRYRSWRSDNAAGRRGVLRRRQPGRQDHAPRPARSGTRAGPAGAGPDPRRNSARSLPGWRRACATSVKRRGPGAALGATGGNRFFYGILFLMSILLYRNDFYHGAAHASAEAHYGYLVAAVAVGYFCAALVTPPVTRRLTKPAFITLLLAASAVVIASLGETFSQPAYLGMGFCLGLAGQGIAICATTILQEQLADDYRGRAFSLYDMMFNITFAVGALISVPFMPLSGKSHALIGVIAAGYVLVAAGYWLAGRHSGAAA